MTIADEIRSMTDEELARVLMWNVPDACEDCKNFDSGCARKCPYERMVELMLEVITRQE